MRISDWSSDVCSSDLGFVRAGRKQIALSTGRSALARLLDKCRHGGAGAAPAHRPARFGKCRKAAHPIGGKQMPVAVHRMRGQVKAEGILRSAEHTSELLQLMRTLSAVFCSNTKTT